MIINNLWNNKRISIIKTSVSQMSNYYATDWTVLNI